jgi:hypothetical protein
MENIHAMYNIVYAKLMCLRREMNQPEAGLTLFKLSEIFNPTHFRHLTRLNSLRLDNYC